MGERDFVCCGCMKLHHGASATPSWRLVALIDRLVFFVFCRGCVGAGRAYGADVG